MLAAAEKECKSHERQLEAERSRVSKLEAELEEARLAEAAALNAAKAASTQQTADSTEATVYAPTEDFYYVQLDEFIEATKKEAKRMSAGSSSKSKAARIAEIQSNRKKEKETILEANTNATLKERGIQPREEVEEPAEEMTLIQRKIREALEKRLQEEES